jgi:osmoprotectant transport system ATP-binding protein
MIRFHGVAKTFGDATALHPTDIHLARGKTTVLIGPSGCGKSTVLRLIAGLLRPTSGTIVVDGRELLPADLLSFRRRLGYVIQDGGLFPHLTGKRNILLAATELNLPATEMAQRLDSLCHVMRLQPGEVARYPLELSGGQRQRVSLIRALMLKPDLLLLDEPLGALDPMVRASLLIDLKHTFSQLRTTVVWVTHDLAEAAHFADHVILLNAGRVIQQGSLADFRRQPADDFVNAFLEAHRILANP